MRGHLVKRSKDSWTIVLSLGRDPQTGKKRQQWHTVRGNKKEAERRMADLLHKAETGELVKPTRITVADFLRQWLRDYAAVNVRPVTAQGYRQKIESYIIPSLGRIPLSQLKPAHIQSFYRKLLDTGLSPRSVLHTHRILNKTLSDALRWGLVGRNAAKAVDTPRVSVKEMQALDMDGIYAILDASHGTPYRPLLHLVVYTGLRRSEVLALRWRDIDLDMATISVARVLHCLKGGQIVFYEPKTQKSRRQVSLSPEPVLALRDHKELQALNATMIGTTLSPDDLAFCKPDGSPILPDTLSHAFADIARRAGFPGIRLHDLRHTHATLMLREGIHPKIVQERLGHATISTTLDLYSHVTPGLQQAAAQKFEDGLRRDTRTRSGFGGLAKD